MNENGLPICNTTDINRPAHNAILNGHESQQVSQSQFICGQQQNERNIIPTSRMSNGGMLLSPITLTQQNGYTSTDMLRQIIANDVQNPNTMKLMNVNSKNMVIKTAPHGAVQITYKKMIHSFPEYKKPIHILPKPTTGDNPLSSSDHQTYVTSPHTMNMDDIKSLKTSSPKLVNSLNNSTGNYLLTTCQTGISSSPCQPELVNYTNSNFSPSVNTCVNINNSVQDSYSSSPRPSTDKKQVNGSSKNLNITLPKIKKSVLMPSLQLHNTSNIMNGEKSLYMPPFNGDTNFDLHASSQFDGSFEMEDVGEFISSSRNGTNQSGDNLPQINDIDMDLLSMDMDTLDAISMTTFLQSETLFNSHLQTDYSLPTTGICKQKLSTSPTGFSVNPIDSHSVDMTVQNIPSEVSNIPKDSYGGNNHVDGDFEIATRTLETVKDVTTDDNMNIYEHLNIIDVSPDTSTTTGGCKIILIGSWNAKDSRYLCKFGDEIVKAELIQNGVLRCYSPKHASGKIKLCVLSDNGLCSNYVDFLIVNPTDTSEEKPIKHNSWMSITTRSLLLLLIDRITGIAEIIGVEDISNLKEMCNNVVCTDTEQLKECQERLVCICKKLMVEKVNFQFDYDVENMTVLHLASALGFTKFIQLLLKWVETNPNKLIKVEACPTQYDQFSLLPIMWSAAKGHFNTTCVLHQWVESTIEVFDACGCTAIDLAKECGHETIAEYLERLQKKSNASKEIAVQPGEGEQCCVTGSLASAPVDMQLQAITANDQSPGGSGFSPRTLGKTLARIQSMISDQDDVSNLDELNLDGEESLFETSPFTPRQRSLPEESNVTSSVTSQHSPSSSSQSLQSPFNRQAFQTAEFCEFFYKARKIEKDFAELTLTDEEQQDLLRAANVIQSAYKTYKERRKRRDQEFCAAVLIQSYYRRYKQYAAFKKMQKGAVVIQNQYRAHREKSKKKVKAASTIQAYYRRYRERKNSSHEDVQLKNKLQQQVDRKANRYLKQTSNRFSKEFPDPFVNDGNSSTSPEPS